MNRPATDLLSRIQRVEDRLDIEQLAVRYALAVDDRDIEGWVGLFVPDVRVGRHNRGRDALREYITPQLRSFYRSIHQIAGHRVELITDDSAVGTVYCRAEHEVGEQWIVVAIRYDDTYRKIDGNWYFDKRIDRHWYEADVATSPQSVGWHGWPSSATRPSVPRPVPAWAEFWAGVDTTFLTGTPTPEKERTAP